MADQLQLMRCFQRVVERGSFSAVAREQGLGQSAISKQVAALEAHLGVRLLARSTHELSLTDEGSEFYRHCINVLAAMDEAEAAIGIRRSEPMGVLRVSCPLSFGRFQIIPRLARFLALYPKLEVELTMSDITVDLVREGLDLAIRIGTLAESELVAMPLGLSQRAVMASRAYVDTHGEPALPEDLQQHECVVYTRLSSRNKWSFDGPAGTVNVQVQGRVRVDSSVGVRGAVLSGLGICMSPTWLFGEELANGTVVRLLPDYPPPPMSMHAVYPKSRHPTPKLRAFVRFLREELERDLQQA